MSKSYVKRTDAEKLAYYKALNTANKRVYKKQYKPRAAVSKKITKSRMTTGKQIFMGGGTAVGGAIGAGIGTYLMPGAGTGIGTTVGGALGGMVGAGLASISGYGSYKIASNVFMNGKIPQIRNKSHGRGTVIRYHEYLGDIYTTSNVGNPAKFTTQSFDLNAANQDTFPYLAQIACNYEQYAFEGLLFQFRSTSADALNSTNSALGSVMMGTQYDVSDPVFASKSEMLNYEYSNSIKPSEDALHMVECAPNQNVLSDLYTLRGPAPINTDARMFNLGRFTIATVGFQASNVNIGELHVTYQVRLLKPKLFTALGNAIDYSILLATGATSYSNGSPLSGIFNGLGQNTLAAYVSSGTCTLPASSVIKTYRIEVNWVGSTSTANTITDPTVANCTLVQSTIISGTNTQCISTFLITTFGNSKTCSFSYGSLTLPSAPLQTVIRIMQMPQIVSN